MSLPLVRMQSARHFCKTVCVGKRTRRGHFATVRNSDVQLIVVDKNSVQVSVANVHCAVRICEVHDNPERV